MNGCYLLHFEEPLHHARHYVGWSDDVEGQIAAHKRGWGAKLVRAVVSAGIGVKVAYVWPGTDRRFERKLHNRHGSRLCPICRAEKLSKSSR